MRFQVGQIVFCISLNRYAVVMAVATDSQGADAGASQSTSYAVRIGFTGNHPALPGVTVPSSDLLTAEQAIQAGFPCDFSEVQHEVGSTVAEWVERVSAALSQRQTGGAAPGPAPFTVDSIPGEQVSLPQPQSPQDSEPIPRLFTGESVPGTLTREAVSQVNEATRAALDRERDLRQRTMPNPIPNVDIASGSPSLTVVSVQTPSVERVELWSSVWDSQGVGYRRSQESDQAVASLQPSPAAGSDQGGETAQNSGPQPQAVPGDYIAATGSPRIPGGIRVQEAIGSIIGNLQGSERIDLGSQPSSSIDVDAQAFHAAFHADRRPPAVFSAPLADNTTVTPVSYRVQDSYTPAPLSWPDSSLAAEQVRSSPGPAVVADIARDPAITDVTTPVDGDNKLVWRFNAADVSAIVTFPALNSSTTHNIAVQINYGPLLTVSCSQSLPLWARAVGIRLVDDTELCVNFICPCGQSTIVSFARLGDSSKYPIMSLCGNPNHILVERTGKTSESPPIEQTDGSGVKVRRVVEKKRTKESGQ